MLRRNVTVVLVLVFLAMLAKWNVTGNGPSTGRPSLLAQQKRTDQADTNRKTASGKRAQEKSAPKRSGLLPPSPVPPSAEAAGVTVLSNGDTYDDFASVAQAADGTVYAAYAAYYDGHDQIRLHKRMPGGNWSTRTHVPLVRAEADIWMPQLAVDAEGRVWVIWCEQTDLTRSQSGNWDLYARSFDGAHWGPVVRLTSDPKPDINPHVTVDAERNIHVVWQAHPRNKGAIQYCHFDGQQWSKPLAVTDGTGSDWYPRIAVDADGTAWIVWDSYRNGDYDVMLTSLRDGKPAEAIPVAQSGFYEAHASVACTPDGTVWVAWEQGGYSWGKDQGYWLRVENRQAGTSLGSNRSVQVVAYREGRWLAGPPLDKLLPAGGPRASAMAGLTSDRDGRLWLRFRQAGRGPMKARNRATRYWAEHVAYLTAEGWQTAGLQPASEGRISVFSRQLPAIEGGLLVAYSGDQRGPANYHQPIRDRVLIHAIDSPDVPAGCPELGPYSPPAAPGNFPAWDTDRERSQVAAIRNHRVEQADQSWRILRGDLHRHTELSWDVGPGNDGSFLDFYRYMIDVAAMDFGGLTDHQGGGHYAYHWWLTEKSCDLYYLAPRFVPIYGYERSAKFPNGHRNVFHSYRGVPVFPFQITLTETRVFPGVATGALVKNDTKLLYEYLRGTDGITISHTSGTDSMGTDWRDNDPEIEPVVEIYQGARNSYEVVGAPRVHDVTKPPKNAPGGFQEAGMVWNALAKGYRLGTTASSDHGSTHISYSLVCAAENSREHIMDAIRQRHTYGGTDNVILEFRCNGHFMGEEYTSSERPELSLKVQGTSDIARIDLIRNNRYIYNSLPDRREVEVQFVDMEPRSGLNYYYFRVLQSDGEIAWSSPIWVNKKEPAGERSP